LSFLRYTSLIDCHTDRQTDRQMRWW